MHGFVDRIPEKIMAVLMLASLTCGPGFAAQDSNSGKSRKLISVTSQKNARRPAAVMQVRPLIKVPYRSWLPKAGKPQLVLLCIHALGFSSKSYDNFGRRMAAAGIPTYALDVRGFGAWIKQPNKDHMDFEACFTDVEQGLKTLHKAYPTLPVFLVGESMGGAIAIQSASRFPELVNGLVTAVPSSEERGGSAVKARMVVAFSAAENPVGQVDMAPIIVDGATNDPALRAKINAEPLNRMELSKKELRQFEKFMEDTHAAAPLVERTPALMLVAYKDKLVTPDGSVQLFSEMTTSQKLMIGDGNSQHLMLEEGQMTAEVERILKGWLREKAGQPMARQGIAVR